jgi:predicted metal-dependent enzyme (double-stranded beta helix superfamily)
MVSGRSGGGNPAGMGKFGYKALSLALSLLAGATAGALSKRVWRLATGDRETPDATDRRQGWTRVLVAAAIEGAVFGLVKAATDRAGAQAYERVTGEWPED